MIMQAASLHRGAAFAIIINDYSLFSSWYNLYVLYDTCHTYDLTFMPTTNL